MAQIVEIFPRNVMNLSFIQISPSAMNILTSVSKRLRAGFMRERNILQMMAIETQ